MKISAHILLAVRTVAQDLAAKDQSVVSTEAYRKTATVAGERTKKKKQTRAHTGTQKTQEKERLGREEKS
jgi:hypothetical protein